MKALRSPAFWAAVSAALLLVGGLVFFRHHHMLYVIPQNGMFPDMPAGTRFWVTKHPYRTIDDVRRGEVIVFRGERNGAPYDYVWRVIGLPGERIAIREDSVLVNGRPLHHRPVPDEEGEHVFEETAGDHIYRIAVPARITPASDFPEVTVPPGHVFVLGDHRHQANDSRVLGPVSFESILARTGFGR